MPGRQRMQMQSVRHNDDGEGTGHIDMRGLWHSAPTAVYAQDESS
jgi:hypothetical protein